MAARPLRLRYDPKLGPSHAEDWVKTYEGGKEVRWADGKLRLDFNVCRVEAICKLGASSPAVLKIDGRKPSEFAELYGFTRAFTKPEAKGQVKWPVIAPIKSGNPLLLEDWTLNARSNSYNEKLFYFHASRFKDWPGWEGPQR